MKLALISLAVSPDSPPLGLVSIATYIEKYSNSVDTTIIDVNFDDIFESLEKIKPDIVGLTAMTIYYPTAVKLAKEIKQKFDIPFIIGGNHVSTLPNSFKKCFDIGVIGEGEETVRELVELYIEKKKFLPSDLRNVKGIVFYDGDHLIKTEPRPQILPLDKIPMPNRDYLNKNYLKKVRCLGTDDFGVWYRIHSSRGCPYRCKFCSPSIMWGTKVRFHSVDRMVEEIEVGISKYHATYISFTDDLFAASGERLKELYKRLKEKDLLGKVKFGGRVRANLVDDELCIILKKLGFINISLGYESGNEEILKYLKGGSVTLKNNYDTILLLEKHKLNNFGSFIFGSPGETLDQMRDTLKLIKFAYQHNITFMYIYLLQPFPGTEIWEIAKKKGLVSDDMDWEKLTLFLDGLDKTHNPIMMDKGVDLGEFKKIYNKAMKYSRSISRRSLIRSFIKDPIKTARYIGNPIAFIKKNLLSVNTLKFLKREKKI